MNEIMVAVIGGVCVAVPSVLSTLLVHNKSQALMSYKLDQLTKQVEKHNKVVERTYILEEKVSVLQSKMDIYHND